jgi:hypothetical protein
MGHATMDCPKCEGDLVLLSTLGHMEIYRCSSCGEETFAMVVPGAELEQMLGLHDTREVIVRTLWKQGAPSASELKALRELVPELAEVSVAELIRRSSGGYLVVGTFRRWEAERLAGAAAARGLALLIEEPATSDHDKP